MSGVVSGANGARVVGTLVLAALVLGGCVDPDRRPTATSPGAAAAGQGAPDVVIAVGSEPDTLNPLLGHARWGDGKVFEGLLRLTEDLEVEPLLAVDLPEVSSDGLTYTYRLREGVTFHDGSPLRAHDVVLSYRTALDPDLGSPVAADLTALESVEALDEHTVRFTLAHPHSSFPVATVLGIVPASSVEGREVAAAGPDHVVGTGPYRVSSYRPGDRLVLTAHDDYWGRPPQVRRATFVFAGDDAARVARLAAGEVDAALVPAQALDRFQDDDRYEVVRRDTADFRALVLPEDHPVAGDPAVRDALHVGLDRQAVVDGPLSGAGRPAFGPIPPEADEYSSVVETSSDPDAARALLDEAGWVEGEDGVRARDGQPAELTLMYPAGDTLRQNIALEVRSQAAGLGIDVELAGLTWEAIEPRMRTDALVYGSGNPYDADLSTYPLFHSSRAFQGFDNPGGYSSTAMDAALETGRASREDQARETAYQQVQQQLAEDLPWIFLAHVGHDYVIRSGTWSGYDSTLVEPHEHGLQGGPWWSLPEWTSAG